MEDGTHEIRKQTTRSHASVFKGGDVGLWFGGEFLF